MAIVISEGKRKINWFAIAVGIFLIVVFGAIIYSLFFIKTPLFDVVFPVEIRSLDELAKIELDPRKVFDHPVYGTLRQFIPLLDIGATTIRENPFMPMP